MYEYLLPVGSVVLLKDSKKKLMICGRIQAKEGDDRIYDYSACFYPEGMVSNASLYFFDHSVIDRVYFIGFQDIEEIVFKNEFLCRLGELEIIDGQIVPKKGEEK